MRKGRSQSSSLNLVAKLWEVFLGQHYLDEQDKIVAKSF